jgi:hypothetical protein
MAGVGEAASIIAVIELSAKIGTLCFQYSRKVAAARKDITRLQGELSTVQDVLAELHQLLQKQGSTRLSTLPEINRAFNDCEHQLNILDDRLDVGKTRKTFSRLGWHALKWPFESKEVQEIVTCLQHCTHIINLALQVDQTYVISPESQLIIS